MGEGVEGADGEEVQAGQRRYLVVPLKFESWTIGHDIRLVELNAG